MANFKDIDPGIRDEATENADLREAHANELFNQHHSQLNTATVAVTIGLDVLDVLIEIASRHDQSHKPADLVMLNIARNAAREAFVNAPVTKPGVRIFRYETEGMYEIRVLLTGPAHGRSDIEVDLFKELLAALEGHDFELTRTITTTKS